jgi:exodeoxyribonuclease V alpha subunit
MLIENRRITPAMMAAHLAALNRLTPFEVRQARFFASCLPDKEHRDDLELLLLLLLACLCRGYPRARTEDLAAGVIGKGGTGDDLMIFENDRAVHQAIVAWYTHLMLEDCRACLKPLLGTGLVAEHCTQPLVIYDVGRRTVSFQALFASEKVLSERIPEMLAEADAAFDVQKAALSIGNALQKSFGDRSPHIRQIAASVLAIQNRFVIISGGPGTGKSTVIHLVLRAVCDYHGIAADQAVLCAPTGRAKARLLEAVTKNLPQEDPFSEIEAFTIHALLETGNRGLTDEHYRSYLPYRLIVVDEASMVDITLFASLIDMMAPGCRMLIAGDMEQLPPVEAGAVLGDLTCRFAEAQDKASLSDACVKEIGAVATTIGNIDERETLPSLMTSATGMLVDHIVFLTHNYRSERGILAWWEQRTGGGAAADVASVKYYTCKSVPLHPGAADYLEALLDEYIRKWHATVYAEWKSVIRPLLLAGDTSAQNPAVAGMLQKLIGMSKIVCCINNGRFGKNGVNRQCDRILRRLAGESAGRTVWHDGQPIIVHRNQHQGVSLYNGDTGIVCEIDGVFHGCFPSRNTVIALPVDRIVEPDLAYAVSVHKAQGSEYDDVMLIVPDAPAVHLSRQLVYTAITRARRTVCIVDPAERLRDMTKLSKEERYGVLREIFREEGE